MSTGDIRPFGPTAAPAAAVPPWEGPLGQRLPWLGYVLALVLPAVVVLAYASLTTPAPNAPYVILFVIPIIISAYVGGLGPGLVCTALALVGAEYPLLAPSRAMNVESRLDLMRWLALIPVGVLVSVLSEALHRSGRRAELALRARAEGEERLRRERALLRALIDSIPDLIFFKDCQSVYLGCNTAFEIYSGLPESALIGKTDLDLTSPEVAAAYRAADREMLSAGHVWRGEEWIPFRNGGGAYFDTIKTPYQGPDGEVLGLIGVSRDVSERKQAEQLLRLRAAALEAAANGIVIADRDGNVEWVNAAFTKLTGYGAAEVIGHNPRILKSGRHDPGFYQELWKTIRDGLVWHGELVNKRKDGSFYSEEMTITPVGVTGGEISHFVAIKQDVTERLRGEDARAELEAQLHAAQKMDALGTLAGGVAHDFNNILGVILGNLELAAQDLGTAHPAAASLDEIRRASQRAQAVVQRILAFSRPQSQVHERITLRPVVEDAVRLLRAAIPPSVDLTMTFADGTPPVMADATQIEQVLVNVCTNAWHALAGPAGRIAIRLDAVTIPSADGTDVPAMLGPGEWARLSVADSGTGMDRATLERIFEPFFTTKLPGKGTGLGLSVVHGIVRAHDGVIDVASEAGHGTTFTIYLPAAIQAEHEAGSNGTDTSDRR